MATALAIQSRAAGSYTSPDVSISKVGDREILVQGTGLSAADLADATFTLTQFVEANDSAGGNAGWYPVYGPDVWRGGSISRFTGQPIPPGFDFINEFTRQNSAARRLRLRVDSSRTATWGFDVTDAAAPTP
jgi:hypothetical protein